MTGLARPLHAPELRAFGHLPHMLHLKTEALVKRHIMFVGGFEIGGKAIFIRTFKTGPYRRAAKPLALMRRVTTGIMEIPDRFLGQMLFNEVSNLEPAENRETQPLDKGHDQTRAIPQAVMRLSRATPKRNCLNAVGSVDCTFPVFVA